MSADALVSEALQETADGIPYGVFTLITERSGPTHVEPAKLMEQSSGRRGYIKELADGRFRVHAKAQHCGVENRNGRVYPGPVWGRHLEEGTVFQGAIGARGVIGHLEHPEDGKSKMPLGAVVVTEAMAPDENGEVWITFETLSTPPGRIVEAYIRCKVRFGLSSRGNGSVVSEAWEGSKRVDVVQEDFEPITWDVVIDESTIGAEVPADDKLREARKDLDSYVYALHERAQSNATSATILAAQDARKAASAIDCEGGVCKCQITEAVVPPSGYSRYLLAFEDGSAHYRAYQGTTGQWEVWMHPHNLAPQILASKLPTLTVAQQVAENHYSLVLGSGAHSAQQHAAQSNAISIDAGSGGMTTVSAPNIGGMAGMMNRQPAALAASTQAVAAPVAPQRTPRIVLTFEDIARVQAQWHAVLAKLEEEWQNVSAMPYSGTVVELSCSSSAECKSALSAIEKAGMFAHAKDDTTVCVYTSYEDAGQAKAHVQRILSSKGLKQSQKTEAVGTISHGRVLTEDNMGISGMRRPLHERGMSGGDTVPEDDEYSDSGGISPEFGGMDPEHLGLDTDVNEEEDDLDYDYMGDDDAEDDEDMEECGMREEDDDMGDDMDYDDMGDDMDYDDMEEGDEEDEEDDEVFERVKKKRKKRSGVSAAEKAAEAKAAKLAYKKLPAGEKTALLKRRKKLREGRAYSRRFNRRLKEGGPVVGAVRVWFNESNKPVSYEYYNSKGMLESVRDARGRVRHKAGRASISHRAGIWEGEDGGYCRPAMFEEELPSRHGGKTLVQTKGTEWQGNSGPEYSMSTMNKPGDRGQDGSGQTPGDYDSASEEGGGEYVEKGTWPESFDARLHSENEALREKVEFLEGELSRYEDIVQEQHEAIREADERGRLMQVEEARVNIMTRHPELRAVAGRLRLCESVEDLDNEVSAMLSLVETVKPAPAPLVERNYGSASTVLRDGIPSGMLTESTRTLDVPRTTEIIGTGDVASRVAAARKRRQVR